MSVAITNKQTGMRVDLKNTDDLDEKGFYTKVRKRRETREASTKE